jgi:hypothetical protein
MTSLGSVSFTWLNSSCSAKGTELKNNENSSIVVLSVYLRVRNGVLMSAALLEKILAELPKLHMGETETKAVISARDTFLRGSSFDGITRNLPGD